jgi:hypothetical protein
MRACPCCGYYTVDCEDDEYFEICKVCYWQYDAVMHQKPNIGGGANKVSLNEARKNFLKFGAKEERFATNVRAPLPEELPENNRAVAMTG